MAGDIGSIGSTEYMEPTRPTTRVLVTAMSSSRPSPLRAKEAEDADVEREVGRGPWRRPGRIPRPSDPAESPATREVRRPPHDDQRSNHDRLRPVDRLRRMVFSDPSFRSDARDDARGTSPLHSVPRPELPHLRPVVRERLPLPPRIRLADSDGEP